MPDTNLEAIQDTSQIDIETNDQLIKYNVDSSAASAQKAKDSADEAIASAILAKNNADSSATNAKNAKKSLDAIVTHVKLADNNVESSASSALRAKSSADEALTNTQVTKNNADSSTANAEITKKSMEAAVDHAKLAENNVTLSNNYAQQAKNSADEAIVSGKGVEDELHKATVASSKAKQEADMAAQAHNMSTTVGLAGAFNKKAQAANTKLILWSFALTFVLVGLMFIGYLRINAILDLIQQLIGKNELLDVIGIEIILLISSIAPFVWGAWLCTKMISKYFHLAEDYSYKAAISQAYVGFKEQANNLDPIFQERLFAAAITQLDSNPLRFFESSAQPGSPLQDLLQQPFIQDALQDNNFKEGITGWLRKVFKTRFYLPNSSISKTTTPE